jgi:hypothetical protein
MNYQLVKQLKDAGFPQLGNGYALILDDIALFESKEDQSMRSIPWALYVNNPVKDIEVLYSPTLSELIEACGYEGFVMWESGGKFYAGKKKDGERGGSYYDDYPNPEEGETLEIAVTKLWLALNKKHD